MFGVEVLVWLPDPQNVSSYYQLMKNLVMGGPLGHSALKITIPSTPAFDNLVKKYCCNKEGEEIIPHYQTQILVKDKTTDPITKEVRYHPKNVSAWVIYFSWWPSGLKSEIDDLILENHEIKVEYEKKWLEFLDVSYMTESRGLFEHWAGERLTNFLLGKAKEVPLPIHTIVHPHPQAVELKKRLDEKRDAYLKVNARLLALHEKSEKLTNDLLILKIRKQYATNNFDEEKINTIDLETEQTLNELNILAKMGEPIIELEATLRKELDEIERHYYKHVATIGCRPSHVSMLPLEGVTELPGGLDLEAMLKVMRKIAKKKWDFHIALYNCSTTSHVLLLSGISEERRKELLSLGLLTTADFQCDLIESPDHVFAFSSRLQSALLSYYMSKLSFAVESKSDALEVSTTPSTVLIQRKRNLSRSAPELSVEGRKMAPTSSPQPRLF